MNHAAIMSVFESLGDLHSDVNRFFDRDPAGRGAIRQRRTFSYARIAQVVVRDRRESLLSL